MVSSSSIKAVLGNQQVAAAPIGQESLQPSEINNTQRVRDISTIAQEKLVTPPMRTSVNEMLATLKQMQSRWLTVKTLAKVVCVAGLMLGGAIAVHQFTAAPVAPVINGSQTDALGLNATHANNTNYYYHNTPILPIVDAPLNLHNHTFTHMKFAQPMQEAPLANNAVSTLQEASSTQTELPSLVSPTIVKPPVPIVDNNATCPVPAELPVSTSEQVPACDLSLTELAKISGYETRNSALSDFVDNSACSFEEKEQAANLAAYTYQSDMLKEKVASQKLAIGDCAGAMATAQKMQYYASKEFMQKVMQTPSCTVEQLEMLPPKISALYHQELYEKIVARRLSHADCQGAMTTANTQKWSEKDVLLKQIFASQNCDISIRQQVIENADLNPTKSELSYKLLGEMMSSPQPNFGQILELAKNHQETYQMTAFLERMIEHPSSTSDDKIQAATLILHSPVSKKFLNQYVEDLFAPPELDFESIIAKSESLPLFSKQDVLRKVVEHSASTLEEKEQAAKLSPCSDFSQKFFTQYVTDMLAQPKPDFKNIIAKSEHLLLRQSILKNVVDHPEADLEEIELAIDAMEKIAFKHEASEAYKQLVDWKLHSAQTDFSGAIRTAKKVPDCANELFKHIADQTDDLALKERIADAMDPHCWTSHPSEMYKVLSDSHRTAGNSTEAERVAKKINHKVVGIAKAYYEDVVGFLGRLLPKVG